MKSFISSRKAFWLLSLVLLTTWITCSFFTNGPPVVHVFLFLAVLVYLRSLMIVEVGTEPIAEK